MQKFILSALASAALALGSYATETSPKEATPAAPQESKKESKNTRKLFQKMSKEDLSESCKKAIEEAKTAAGEASDKTRSEYHIELATVNMNYISKATNDREAHMFGRRCMREVMDAKRTSKHHAKADTKKAEAPKKDEPKVDEKK
jgi:hypothetical protein